MFKVEVKKDDHFPDKAWLRITHNGSSWASLALNSQAEIDATIKALQEFDVFQASEGQDTEELE